MLADPTRMGAFARALERVVKPDSVVVDLGAGTGIMALLACRFGARRVFAIEPAEAIQVARDIAARNGFADRIDFIQKFSTDVVLPERADVIVSDIGGIMPWFHRHIPSLADARERFLAPGGVMIPARDDVWAAVVEAPALYARKTSPWTENAYGFDMTPARDVVLNTWTRGRVAASGFLSRPSVFATLDYQTIVEPNLAATVCWKVERRGTGHGLIAGFHRMVWEGIRLSNVPDTPENEQSGGVYDTVFFPWLEPVTLEAGDTVVFEIKATLVHEDYVWRWRSRLHGANGAEKASFSQSSFLGTPLSRDTLNRVGRRHVPRINE